MTEEEQLLTYQRLFFLGRLHASSYVNELLWAHRRVLNYRQLTGINSWINRFGRRQYAQPLAEDYWNIQRMVKARTRLRRGEPIEDLVRS